METHNFGRVSDESPDTLRKLCVFTSEITVLYALCTEIFQKFQCCLKAIGLQLYKKNAIEQMSPWDLAVLSEKLVLKFPWAKASETLAFLTGKQSTICRHEALLLEYFLV